MRKELIKHADWNVIIVDWAGGSLPLYTQATANTRLVGLEVAYFVNYLKVKETYHFNEILIDFDSPLPTQNDVSYFTVYIYSF